MLEKQKHATNYNVHVKNDLLQKINYLDSYISTIK